MIFSTTSITSSCLLLAFFISFQLDAKGYSFTPFSRRLQDKATYLMEDDNRHDDDLYDLNKSDPPAIPNFSSIPTSVPSSSPSSFPSSTPSSSPSYSPSSSPSENPTWNPCAALTGWFGSESEIKLRVQYAYEIEYNETVLLEINQDFNDIQNDVEVGTVAGILNDLFNECSDYEPAAVVPNIFQSIKNGVRRKLQRRLSKLVGISTLPTDIVSKEPCSQTEIESYDCKVIEGELSLYVSNNQQTQELISYVLALIRYIMDNGYLNDIHPSVISITYKQESSEPRSPGPNPDPSSEPVTNEKTKISLGIWALTVIAGVSFIVFIIFLTVVNNRRRSSENYDDTNESTIPQQLQRDGGLEVIEDSSIISYNSKVSYGIPCIISDDDDDDNVTFTAISYDAFELAKVDDDIHARINTTLDMSMSIDDVSFDNFSDHPLGPLDYDDDDLSC